MKWRTADTKTDSMNKVICVCSDFVTSLLEFYGQVNVNHMHNLVQYAII